jgi:hypothetical protein
MQDRKEEVFVYQDGELPTLPFPQDDRSAPPAFDWLTGVAVCPVCSAEYPSVMAGFGCGECLAEYGAAVVLELEG